VDCFAGKGVFEDGKPGSPIIALRTISDCLGQTKMNLCTVQRFFVDLNYADDLRENTKDYEGIKIISGKYEENIDGILCDKTVAMYFYMLTRMG